MKIGNRRMTWRLAELMRARKINTVQELHSRLAQVTTTAVSLPNMYKLVAQTPIRLNVTVLLALTIVLRCGVQDLLKVVDDDEPPGSRRK